MSDLSQIPTDQLLKMLGNSQQPQQQRPSAPQQPQQPQGEENAVTDNSIYAALHGAADTATFGLADKASAALGAGLSHILPGVDPMSYSEAYKRVQANTGKVASEHPIATLVGDVGGAVGGGGLISAAVKGAKAIPVLGKVAEGAESLLAAKKGQPVSNVLRNSAIGAGVSGTDTALRGGDANQVLESAGAGAVLSPVLGAVGTKVVKALSPAADKAFRLLADKIGETPDALQTAFNNFRSATGRAPSMAELVGLRSRGELRELAAGNPTVGEATMNAASAANAARPGKLAETIDQIAGPRQDINSLVTARKDRMTAAMKPINDRTVELTPQDADLIGDPRVLSSFERGSPLRAKLHGVLEDLANGSPVNTDLTVKDIDGLRRALRGRQGALIQTKGPYAANELGDLASSISNLAADQHPDYRSALQQFAQDSDYIHGFKHGLGGKTIGEAEAPEVISALGTPHGQQGFQSGNISRLANQAAGSEAGAQRTAAALAENTGEAQQLNEAFGTKRSALTLPEEHAQHIQDIEGLAHQDVARKLQQAGHFHNKSAEALNDITPRGVRPTDEEQGTLQATHAAAAGAYHSPAAIMYHLTRVLGGKVRLSEPVQRKIAEYLVNPQMTQQGINLLRKAGVQNDDLRRLTGAIAASTGVATSQTLSGE